MIIKTDDKKPIFIDLEGKKDDYRISSSLCVYIKKLREIIKGDYL